MSQSVLDRRRWTFSATLTALVGLIVGCGASESTSPPPNIAAIPNLIQSLESRDPTARTNAAIALARMGPEAREAVPALIAVLKDREVSVRSAAAFALGRIGVDAKSATSELQRLAKQTVTREVAVEALERIGAGGP